VHNVSRTFCRTPYTSVFPVFNKTSAHEDVWGSGGMALTFMTSALDGGEWSASRPGHFTRSRKSPGAHLLGD
jgi:hypothetical protein